MKFHRDLLIRSTSKLSPKIYFFAIFFGSVVNFEIHGCWVAQNWLILQKFHLKQSCRVSKSKIIMWRWFLVLKATKAAKWPRTFSMVFDCSIIKCKTNGDKKFCLHMLMYTCVKTPTVAYPVPPIFLMNLKLVLQVWQNFHLPSRQTFLWGTLQLQNIWSGWNLRRRNEKSTKRNEATFLLKKKLPPPQKKNYIYM